MEIASHVGQRAKECVVSASLSSSAPSICTHSKKHRHEHKMRIFIIVILPRDFSLSYRKQVNAALRKTSRRIAFFILLTHEGSHREVYQEFQPSYDIFPSWCQGLFRPQVPCTPSLHCPIANSASTLSQQSV